MKSSGRNPAQMSHTSKTLPLMSPALKKIIRRGATDGGIILVKVWEIMERYN